MTSDNSQRSAQILKRLRVLGMDIPEGSHTQRLYRKRGVHSPNGWVWHVVDADGNPLGIGSADRMTKVVVARNLDITRDSEGNTTVALPRRTSTQEDTPRQSRNKAVRIQGIQVVEVLLEDTPDVTPEHSTFTFSFRPHVAEIRYERASSGVWELTDIRVTGRPLNKDRNGVDLQNHRIHHVCYTDVTGKGGIQRAKTPAWVVDLATQYADITNIPDL
jgi:hypothetical protein